MKLFSKSRFLDYFTRKVKLKVLLNRKATVISSTLFITKDNFMRHKNTVFIIVIPYKEHEKYLKASSLTWLGVGIEYIEYKNQHIEIYGITIDLSKSSCEVWGNFSIPLRTIFRDAARTLPYKEPWGSLIKLLLFCKEFVCRNIYKCLCICMCILIITCVRMDVGRLLYYIINACVKDLVWSRTNASIIAS